LDELSPRYISRLTDSEVLALLSELAAADLPGTRVEKAWVHAMLIRHSAARRCTAEPTETERDTASAPQSSPHDDEPGNKRLATRVEAALPRLADEALRQDLQQVLYMLKRVGWSDRRSYA
jgi:hypothetical protein